MPWKLVLISLAAAAVVWVPLGLWLAWRHNFDIRAQLGWAVFHLLCGLPGFLAFLSVQEWPARSLAPTAKSSGRLTAKNANTVARTLRRPKRTAPKSSHPWKPRGPDSRRGRFCFRRSVSPRGFSFLNSVPIWHGNAASAASTHDLRWTMRRHKCRAPQNHDTILSLFVVSDSPLLVIHH